MVEENNIKYYFRGDSGDYSFDGARRVLNETPVEGEEENGETPVEEPAE